MRKVISFLSMVAVAGLLAFANSADDNYTVDTEKSSVGWLGKKVTGQHNGTVKLKDGSLVFKGNALKSGSFSVDMSTIVATDGSGKNLLDHLKSPDFFGVEKNPVSTFAITKVTAAGKDQVTISGDLTIKGIKNPLTFPATVKKQGDVVVAVAKGVKVDRTKYDIKYNSKSFFGSIGDKAIDDEFELSINLVAKK